MGARRNDDADLELRDDYFHPVSPAAPSAAAPRKPNQNGADEQQHQTPAKSKSSGMSSYLPFSYFGLTSPAPTPAKDNNNIMNGTNNMNGASSPVPPPRSFPPPISESHDEGDDAAGDSDGAGKTLTDEFFFDSGDCPADVCAGTDCCR